jgi:uncharacterized surface protein with fasciclin (FAS1) repeats
VASSLQPGTAWTILAPTNDAFATRLQAALGITPQQLLEPSNKDTLVKVRQRLRLINVLRLLHA